MADIARDRLSKVPFTEELTDEQINALLPEARVVDVAAGKAVPPGEPPGNTFYYVESGHLRVEAHDPTRHKINYRDAGQGEYVGLYSLITGRPAHIDAQATQDSTLLAFPADMLHRYLVSGVRQQACLRGEVLFKQDQTAEFLYFVLEGRFLLEREVKMPGGGVQTVRRSAGPGEYLGRYALITSQTFRTKATAERNSSVLAIPFRALQPLLFIHPGWREWFFPLELAERLRAIPLFKALEDRDIYLLADETIPMQLQAGEHIYHVEDPAEHFYVIDRGQVEEQPREGEGPWYLAAGNYFGEDSLKGGWQRRSATVATKPTRVLRLAGHVVGEMLQQHNVKLEDQGTRGSLVDRLGDVSLFKGLPRHHLRRLAGYVNLVYFRPGDVVARQGEPADKLMILHEGEAVVLRQSTHERARAVRRLNARPHEPRGSGESEYFGDQALVKWETRGATVEVTQPSAWIVLERGDFQQFLKDTGLTEADLGRPAAPDKGKVLASPQSGVLSLPWQRHRHWIVPVVNVVPALILAVVTLAWLVLVPGDLNRAPDIALFVVRVLFCLICIGRAGWSYWDWRNDVFIITAEAVVHIERKPLTSEQRYEAPLRQIQNVNLGTSLIGEWLGYGDVLIETAAARGQVTFGRIPDPQEAQGLIRRAADAAKSGRQVKEMESIRQRLEDRLVPERLKPGVPGSVLVESPAQPKAQAKANARRRSLSFLPRFEERSGETITWRKHWVNLLQRTGLPVLATGATGILLLVLVVPTLARMFGADVPTLIDMGIWTWLVVVLFVLSMAWLKYQYVDWENDIYVLKGDQVIDQERQLAPFPLWWWYSESRKAAVLSNVQYVDLRIPHMLALILNYGDVIVQTAGATGQLDFLTVSDPRRVHDTILRYLAEFQERERQRQFDERWHDMAQWLEAYHEVTRREQADGA
ncbi:MAG: cyclic nucleotide-binding domain-containing protein [Anaerolineae bacterium]|nr:cyclic nucleotide-binding domain-containing protein [Anaerolineae bacterium]